MTDYFVDTCVILARAYGPKIEGQASLKSEKIFIDVTNRIYTSQTVNDELTLVHQRRTTYYASLLRHIATNGKIDSFQTSQMSASDASHFRKIIGNIRKNKSSTHLRLTRLKIARIDASIVDSRKKIVQPLISKSNHTSFHSLLLQIGVHNPDNEIVTDYIDFVIAGNILLYVTKDGKQYKLRANIISEANRYFGISNGINIEHIDNV